MKIIGMTALHYGADYLGWAIRSIIDYVDEYYILYANNPSHGTRNRFDIPPEREAIGNLNRIASEAAGDKLRWYVGNWRFEGEQRDAIHDICPDADVVLVLDSDEIWHWRILQELSLVLEGAIHNSVWRYRLPIIHYWRSFRKCVLHDPAFPERVIFPRNRGKAVKTYRATRSINHMGYAIMPDIMDYKWTIHGHKNELRTDVNWYRDVFLANRQKDCHPCGSEYWNPEDVNPLDYMPSYMEQHPFFNMEVIE